MKKINLAILGATGAVGREMLKVLYERNFPIGELRALASARSAGTKLPFGDTEITVQEANEQAFEGMDIKPFLEAENYSLYFRPYTRKTTVWEDALQQAGAFLDPWQKPDDAALMAKACDNAQKIIEDAIAAE